MNPYVQPESARAVKIRCLIGVPLMGFYEANNFTRLFGGGLCKLHPGRIYRDNIVTGGFYTLTEHGPDYNPFDIQGLALAFYFECVLVSHRHTLIRLQGNAADAHVKNFHVAGEHHFALYFHRVQLVSLVLSLGLHQTV
jgi:hypothetical protein